MSNWKDLRVRVFSAIVLIAIGGGAIWAGGLMLLMLLIVMGLTGLWELFHMGRHKARTSKLNIGDCVVLCLYGVLVVTGAAGLWQIDKVLGFWALPSVIAIVAVTDIMGYFAGRAIGGPKFWPRISPKKTWAGIVGGWVGAVGLVLAIAGLHDNFYGEIIPIEMGEGLFVIAGAVALSAVSQIGDITQSALKRRMGVKDSSSLIPGHGGVLDRFDGLLAVGFLALLLMY